MSPSYIVFAFNPFDIYQLKSICTLTYTNEFHLNIRPFLTLLSILYTTLSLNLCVYTSIYLVSVHCSYYSIRLQVCLSIVFLLSSIRHLVTQDFIAFNYFLSLSLSRSMSHTLTSFPLINFSLKPALSLSPSLSFPLSNLILNFLLLQSSSSSCAILDQQNHCWLLSLIIFTLSLSLFLSLVAAQAIFEPSFNGF